MTTLNETHDPQLKSWVQGADDPGCPFPIQNLPFGVFRRQGTAEAFRGGVAIGDQILDVGAAAESGAIAPESIPAARACADQRLNTFMATGPDSWSSLRLALSRGLRERATEADALRRYLVPQAEVEYAVPASIGDYTDFYTSLHHATNVGRLFRPDNPLLPNYKWIPIGYHGRASSIGVSGQTFHRPVAQTRAADAKEPKLGPSQRLDYELELGLFVGLGNSPGSSIPIDEADAHMFGVCLLNDWSARDVQAWEYQPLGPFLSKNFATTISPWIVTLEALAPYRAPWTRPAEDPAPLPYLDSPRTRASGAFDIEVEVLLETETMRRCGNAPTRLAGTSFRHAYWTLSQILAHHTVNGCGLASGDLLGSGTLSGPTPEEVGSLLELTVGGKDAVDLDNGETRIFVEDGDTVIMRGWCEKAGAARIGLGEVRSTVLPSKAP